MSAFSLNFDARAGLFFTAAFDIGVVFSVLAVWKSPGVFSPDDVKWFVGVFMLEFLMVHSGPFLGYAVFDDVPRRTQVKRVAAMGSLYLLFAAGFTLSLGSLFPLAAMSASMAEKLSAVWLGSRPRPARKAELQYFWGIGALAYLFACAMSVAVSWPRWGITPDVVRSQGFAGSGLWEQQPQAALAACAIYFGWLAIARLRIVWTGSIPKMPGVPGATAPKK